ncbi:MAG: radical SAM family heme chaperone HemW [Christensenellales bacterium]
MRPLGLYVHIPFCRRKCHYCDFVSFSGMEGVFNRYIDAVIAEAKQYKKLFKEYVVDTVFIGGGTPSVLEIPHIIKLVSGINNAFRHHIKEFTIETNPEKLNAEKLSAYSDLGINRVSIGLQSHDDTILRRIGRRHTWDDFLRAYTDASRFFKNINTDIIFGLPGQTTECFFETVEKVISLKPQHVSAYSLKVEQTTPLAKSFSGADEDTDRAMYHGAVDMLESAGYVHYETSNFALPEFECGHNLKYWTCAEYLGLGVAAHSFAGDARRSNTESLQDYMEATESRLPQAADMTKLGEHEKAEEYIMLRMRLADGIVFNDYNTRFNKDFSAEFLNQISAAQKMGLIVADKDGIRPTKKGFDLQNTLICEFIK